MNYALISVSDKEGVLSLASGLLEAGFKIIATGGTAHHLQENNLPVTMIEDVTGFPEILDGRVKTLHPAIFGGILADREKPHHIHQLQESSINTIEVVVINLYPFQNLLKKLQGGAIEISHKMMIENIDIGGVSLLRAAAKNYQHVSVLSDINDYKPFLEELENNESISLHTRRNLARKAFAVTSTYDRFIYQYFSKINQNKEQDLALFPGWQETSLRYGENPHQKGSYYSPGTQGIIEQLHGKQLSYNNYLDINAALRLIYRFTKPTAAILKHTNPCGVASSDDLLTAYNKCFETDPLSPFGGIVVLNKNPDLETARAIDQIFTEIVIAPGFDTEVKRFLSKKKNRRLISYKEEMLDNWAETQTMTSCLDGLLCQEIDIKTDEEDQWLTVTGKTPDEDDLRSLRFAWKVVTALKSNAICLSAGEQTIGLGMGQTSRIDSAELAVYRAEKFGHSLMNTVCASDGFFPFRDAVDFLAAKGVKAIIQPGGSKGDKEVIDACNEHGISMIFTGKRHFAHI